ncbi:uncharacterized protein BKA55DRAFT_590964 [Fusarium redolens]|uniref:Uncharacterized protein n=1 Tax=Fusarium redolens TaxID=48865 RepID=A0A9P9HNV3_FUSRE|nr:uncharacterized protein BKA55DRAFT_590964 [Fusarium redolens]KAH7260646.1 hypothetical protein BKA55DRAFT_590964 [Fusarium redolens]
MHLLPPDVAAQNKGPAMMAVMYSFTALSSLTVGFVFTYVGCWTAAILAGSGHHQATLTVAEFDRSVFFLMIGMVPGVLSLALPKFAVVNLLIKILFPSPRHVRLLWGLAIANLCRSSTAIIVYSVVVGLLWSLHIHLKKKLALSVALGFGAWLVYCRELLPVKSRRGLRSCLSAGCAAIRKVTTVLGMGDEIFVRAPSIVFESNK